MCKFYEKLYNSNYISDASIDAYLESVENICCLKAEDQYMWDEFPSLQECRGAVFDMKQNKSPGLDDIPNEFYQTFWSDLDTMFYGVLREMFDNDEMSFSQRLAVVSLIHKKGEKLC